MLVVFIGPPGSGKGTQSKRLVEHLGMVHLSTGDMLRQAIQQGTKLGRLADQYMSAGKLVPDETVIGIVDQRLDDADCKAGCLFDGFPRTLPQAEALDVILKERDMPLCVVLELKTDEAELQRRMLQRAQIEQRPDDTPQTLSRRMQVYHQQTEPLLEYYSRKGLLKSIDGMGMPDEVFARIRDCVDSLGNGLGHHLFYCSLATI